MDWILPEGAPWRIALGSAKVGKAHRDIPIEFAELTNDHFYIKVYVSQEVATELHLFSCIITVAIDHIMKQDDTRPMIFRAPKKNISELIESLQEKIYDSERNLISTSKSTFFGWKTELTTLKKIKYRSDNKDKHD